MRAFKAIFSLFLVAVLLFLPYRILQFIALLYLFTVAASFAYSRITAGAIRVRRRDPVLRAHRFEPIEIVLSIENTRLLPLPYITAIDLRGPLFSKDSGKFVLRLRSRERKRLAYRIESQSRGEYPIGPVVVVGSDPLGLFPWSRRVSEKGRLIVYPEVLPISRRSARGLPAGSLPINSRIYEDVTRYRSLREYVPGDDARRISWKVSARTGRLHSMEYLPALFSPVLILLNMNAEEFPLRFRSHWVERSTVTAASLVMYFISLKQEVGLVSSGRLSRGEAAPMARMSSAPGHATAIMEILACMEPSSLSMDFTSLLAASGLDIPVGTRIEVITPRVTQEQGALLRESRRKGWQIELFLIGGELFEGRERLSREFPVFGVTDYGNELIAG